MKGGVDPQDGLDPQSGNQQRGLELHIPPLHTTIPSHTKGVQFESTFPKSAFTKGPSTQPSHPEPSFFGPTFIEPTYGEIPQPHAPLAPGHASWMDLSTQICFLSTHMEELTVVTDHDFTPWRIGWTNIKLGSLLNLSLSNRGLIALRITQSKGLLPFMIAWSVNMTR